MPALPPWLDFSPQTFMGAAESGRRAGQEDQRIGLERQSLAQSAAQAAAELSLKHQQLDAEAKQRGIENQIAQQQMQEQFQQQQTRQAVTDAYHQQQYGFEKQRLEQAAQKTMKLGNDVYTVNVNTGEMKKVLSGPGTGATGGTVKITEPASTGTPDTPGDPGSPGHRGFPLLALTGFPWLGLTGWGPRIGATPPVPPTPGTPGTPAHPARTFSYRVPGGTTAADAFRMADGGAGTKATGTISPFQQRPPDIVSGTQDSTLITPATLPKAGTVVNGYTFKGGDPADEKNWSAAAN